MLTSADAISVVFGFCYEFVFRELLMTVVDVSKTSFCRERQTEDRFELEE